MAIAKDLSGNAPVTGPEAHIPDPHNVAGSGGTTTVKATAAAPTYIEGSTANPVSADLAGNMRVVGNTTAVKSTAAAPTYSEGAANNPFSTDLAGNLRVTGGAAPSVKSTAAAPNYTEGATNNPFSSDLLGNLRIVGNTAPVKATAAAPTYIEASVGNPFSVDLAGNLRVTGTTSTTVKSTAAAPTYTEGANNNPMSSDLKGRLRTAIQNSAGVDVDFSADGYEAVAASQTNQVMGGAGALGDILDGVLIIPGTVGCGAVSIKDGSNTAITIFVGGGTTALPSCIPFFVPLGIASAQAGWQITTGANVTAIGVGKFT